MADKPGIIAWCWRRLRVVTTVVFGLICVAATVLWVRSYWHADAGMVSILPKQHIAFHGGLGRMCVWLEHSRATQWFGWRSSPIHDPVAPGDARRIPVFDLAFFWPKMTRLYIAHWVIVLAAATLAAAPWYPKRFRSRDMMIAVTGFSIVCALIAWIDRTF